MSKELRSNILKNKRNKPTFCLVSKHNKFWGIEMNTTLFRPLIFHSSVPENACRIPKDNFHRLQPNMTP